MSEWTRPAQPVRCVVELDKPLAVHRERGVLAQGDANANAIVAEVYSTAGKPYDLSGCTMQLIFVRPDNNALPAINAEINGNTATATLPDSAYTMSGMYSLRMQLRKNGAERTIVWIIGEVKGTDVDGIADPEHVISIGDIMASAKEAQTAASNANTAAERANAGAERAEQLQIDASGLAGDSNKLGGKHPSHYLPVENLLDNSDWRVKDNIINQRRFTGGAPDSDNAYFIDRWMTYQAYPKNITIEFDGGLKITPLQGRAGLKQFVKTPSTGVTLAIEVNGSIHAIYSNHGVDALKNLGNGLQGRVKWNATNIDVTITGDAETTGTYTVAWMALYEGEYTDNALPPYVPRPYTVELAECQRYYYRSWIDPTLQLAKENDRGWVSLAAVSSSGCEVGVILPQAMRVIPDVVLYSALTLTKNKISCWETAADVAVDATATKETDRQFSVSAPGLLVKGNHYQFYYEANADL